MAPGHGDPPALRLRSALPSSRRVAPLPRRPPLCTDVLVDKGSNHLYSTVGLPHPGEGPPAPAANAQVTCQICCEAVDAQGCPAMLCGHVFCPACWTQHLKVGIEDGKARNLRCATSREQRALLSGEQPCAPHRTPPPPTLRAHRLASLEDPCVVHAPAESVPQSRETLVPHTARRCEALWLTPESAPRPLRAPWWSVRRCMAYKCGAPCDEAVVARLLQGTPHGAKYKEALATSYVDDNSLACFCPSAPWCGHAVVVSCAAQSRPGGGSSRARSVLVRCSALRGGARGGGSQGDAVARPVCRRCRATPWWSPSASAGTPSASSASARRTRPAPARCECAPACFRRERSPRRSAAPGRARRPLRRPP